MSQKQRVRFFLIQVEPLEKLNLSLLEYCLADAIYHLSTNPNSSVPGWCYAAKSQLAKMLRVSDRNIYNLLTNLIETGLVEKHPETNYLRTTDKWYEEVVVYTSAKIADPVQEVQLNPLQKLQTTSAKIADNIYNNKNKLDNAAAAAGKDWNVEDFKKYQELMNNHANPAVQLIAYYFGMKSAGVETGALQFKNKIEIQTEVRRNLRPANDLLKTYKLARVQECIEDLTEFATFAWTLETVMKFMSRSREERLKALKGKVQWQKSG